MLWLTHGSLPSPFRRECWNSWECQRRIPSPPATVERIDTHASVVFLAGPFAYKVKRAVKYPFLDFSTLAKRQAACLNELRVNARTAPQLYLEVVPVTLDESGAFRLGGEGEAVEWVLRMRRFDQAMLYDRMASEGRLDLASMPRLAAVDRSVPRFRRPRAVARASGAAARRGAARQRGRIRRQCRCAAVRAGRSALPAPAGTGSPRLRPCSRRGRAEAMCATATAICICAISSRSTARPSCSTRSNSTTGSPRSTCSTISPFC